MKVAVSSVGDTLDSAVDPRFGRAAQFLLVDTDSGEHQLISNAQNLNAAQGAGIQAAQTVAELGVDAVLTGHCGPKAFATLSAAEVTIFPGASGVTVAEAVEKYKSGTLTAASNADVDGHWV